MFFFLSILIVLAHNSNVMTTVSNSFFKNCMIHQINETKYLEIQTEYINSNLFFSSLKRSVQNQCF